MYCSDHRLFADPCAEYFRPNKKRRSLAFEAIGNYKMKSGD